MRSQTMKRLLLQNVLSKSSNTIICLGHVTSADFNHSPNPTQIHGLPQMGTEEKKHLLYLHHSIPSIEGVCTPQLVRTPNTCCVTDMA
jgi:hypothetical protein